LTRKKSFISLTPAVNLTKAFTLAATAKMQQQQKLKTRVEIKLHRNTRNRRKIFRFVAKIDNFLPIFRRPTRITLAVKKATKKTKQVSVLALLDELVTTTTNKTCFGAPRARAPPKRRFPVAAPTCVFSSRRVEATSCVL
jgi:hypothetical protein